MKNLRATLLTIGGRVHDINVAEDVKFLPADFTDKTIWRFVNTDGDAVLISGSKIDSIVIEQKPRSWWRR